MTRMTYNVRLKNTPNKTGITMSAMNSIESNIPIPVGSNISPARTFLKYQKYKNMATGAMKYVNLRRVRKFQGLEVKENLMCYFFNKEAAAVAYVTAYINKII